MTPRTKAGAAWDATVRSAVLDPAVAKMVGADGRQVLLSLVNPDANRDAVRDIEDEMLDTVAAAVEGTRGQLCARGFTSVAHVRRSDVLAAIERIRKDDDG